MRGKGCCQHNSRDRKFSPRWRSGLSLMAIALPILTCCPASQNYALCLEACCGTNTQSYTHLCRTECFCTGECEGQQIWDIRLPTKVPAYERGITPAFTWEDRERVRAAAFGHALGASAGICRCSRINYTHQFWILSSHFQGSISRRDGGRQAERVSDRQADRQTDRETERQSEREKQREAERERERERRVYTYIYICHAHMCI